MYSNDYHMYHYLIIRTTLSLVERDTLMPSTLTMKSPARKPLNSAGEDASTLQTNTGQDPATENPKPRCPRGIVIWEGRDQVLTVVQNVLNV